MREWVRIEGGEVVERVWSALPDEDFLLSRPGQDMRHIEDSPPGLVNKFDMGPGRRLSRRPYPSGSGGGMNGPLETQSEGQ